MIFDIFWLKQVGLNELILHVLVHLKFVFVFDFQANSTNYDYFTVFIKLKSTEAI